ncbi:MAG: ribonuclease HII [Pseudanabaenaceae cyanobacterium]
MRIAGVDEVGRGALFGPVVAAAVVLSPDGYTALAALGVTDSKRLSPRRREMLYPQIHHQALAVGLGSATVSEIQRLNILTASLLAMERAIAALGLIPDLCRIDGNQPLRFQEMAPLPQETVVQGDRQCLEIAAASIVAKVWRDRAIAALDREYPGYDLARNKGYPTPKHRAALSRLGPTPLHRWP